MSSSAKRKVIQRLHDMGFSDNDIRAAITECGYHVEQCADWIVNRKPTSSKPKLFVGMEVWIYSPDDNDWCPGNVVSITKQLLSIIFNGHDFRWLEKESDLYKIQDDKPIPLITSKQSNYYNQQSSISQQQQQQQQINAQQSNDPNDPNVGVIDPNDPTGYDPMEHQYTPPKNDETDYYVTFTESVLGLELYSDEDGFNCIVGRCVSTIARQKVTPGSQIVQVNDRWLANYRFEEIRDAVKQAARQPPLAVTFRIKKNLLRPNKKNKQQQSQQQPVIPVVNNVPNTANLFSASPYQNGNDYSQSATSPDIPNPYQQQQQQANGGNPNGIQQQQQLGDPNIKSKPIVNNKSSNKNDIEEKQAQPNGFGDDKNDFMGTLSFEQCDKLQIGDHIDHRDDVGRFLLATIVDKDEYKVKIHYEGWNSKWDTWCDYKAETHRFARPRSISRKPNTRFRDLKIRDYVDINPIQRHKGWRVGQIRRMDKYSGQAQIVYKEDGQEFLYWAHLNNPEEIAPFMTKAAETIALQQKIAEFEEQEHQKSLNANVIQQKQQQMNPINLVNNNNNSNNSNDNNNNKPNNQIQIQQQAAIPQQQQQQNKYQQQNGGYNNMQNGYNNGMNGMNVDANGNYGGTGKSKDQLLSALQFVAPAVSSVPTSIQAQYNPDQNQNNNQIGHQQNGTHSSLKFDQINNSPQPPPAQPPVNNNNNNNNPNMQNNNPMYMNNQQNMNMNPLNGMNGMNGMNQQAMHGMNQAVQHGHKKQRSRILPRAPALKNKPLPPKPPKNLSRKKNKNFARSRTQPLPDNRNNHNQQHINQLNMNNPYANNTSSQQQQQQIYQMNIQQANQVPQTTNFADISFGGNVNAANQQQTYQSQPKQKSVTHLIHYGNTTYTSQVSLISRVKPKNNNNINKQSPFGKKYSGDQYDNI